MRNFQFMIVNHLYTFRHSILKWGILVLFTLNVGCVSGRTTNTASHTPLPFNLNQVEIMFWQNEQYLWIGNRQGIARLGRDRSLEIFFNISCSSPVITYNPELVWCNGNLFDGSKWQMTDSNVDSPLQAPDKTIWAGGKNGLARFDVATRSWSYALRDASTELDTAIIFNNPGPGIHLEMITQDGALWFYAYTGRYIGINRWTGNLPVNWPMFSEDSIMVPQFEASDGSVWAKQYPPYQNKIAYWDGHNWKYMNPFSGIGSPMFIEAKDKTVWIASGAHEVGRWGGEEWQIWSPFEIHSNIIDILEGADQSIWIISEQNSVGRWNGNEWQIWNENEITLPIEAEGQSACLTTNPKKFFPSIQGQTHKSEAKPAVLDRSLVDQAGNIWIVLSLQKGIIRWTGSCWQYYTTSDGLTSDDVSVLTFGPDGTVWAGTRNAGINYYNPDEDRWYSFP